MFVTNPRRTPSWIPCPSQVQHGAASQAGPALLPNGPSLGPSCAMYSRTQFGPKLKLSGSNLGTRWGHVDQSWPKVEPMLRTRWLKTITAPRMPPCRLQLHHEIVDSLVWLDHWTTASHSGTLSAGGLSCLGSWCFWKWMNDGECRSSFYLCSG